MSLSLSSLSPKPPCTVPLKTYVLLSSPHPLPSPQHIRFTHPPLLTSFFSPQPSHRNLFIPSPPPLPCIPSPIPDLFSPLPRLLVALILPYPPHHLRSPLHQHPTYSFSPLPTTAPPLPPSPFSFPHRPPTKYPFLLRHPGPTTSPHSLNSFIPLLPPPPPPQCSILLNVPNNHPHLFSIHKHHGIYRNSLFSHCPYPSLALTASPNSFTHLVPQRPQHTPSPLLPSSP